MEYRFVTVEIKDRVAVVTLNRPEKRNALSGDLMDELLSCLMQLRDNPEVNVLVMKGAGPAFSSGHDLKELVGKDSTAYRAKFEKSLRLMEVMTNMPKPVIASVQGYASAAGLQLAAACDLVVASEDSRFETPGVKIGLFCITPMVSLARSVGRKKALEMLLTGEYIDAREAKEIGLVNRVVPKDKLEEATMNLANKIAGFSTVPISFGKQAFYAAADMEYLQAFRYAKELMAANTATEDAQEGMKAFLEKRTPQWKGR